MTTQSNLIGSGIAPLAARSVVGFPSLALTAAGTTQVTALPLPSDFNVVTTAAASSGVILPATGPNIQVCDSIVVVNYGANAITVYPPVGGAISNATVNTGVSVAVNKLVEFFVVGVNSYAADVSA